MTHPIVLAAKAAWGELTTEEAKAFFKSTAVCHTLLVAYYALETVHWTVEAGRLTRRFVDSFNSMPQEAPTIAGLLPPTKDELPITTAAIVTNQQKLEQHIIQTLQDKFNVQSNQESDQVGQESSSEALQEPVLLQPDPHQKTKEAATPRQRKPRGSTASGNGGQSSNKPNPESGVSRTGSRVQGKRHTENADV